MLIDFEDKQDMGAILDKGSRSFNGSCLNLERQSQESRC